MAGDVWQGGLVSLPYWIEQGPDGTPYRPRGAVWVSVRSGRLTQQIESAPGTYDHTLAMEALVEFGLKKSLAGFRPERIEVVDETLADALRRMLEDADTSVSVVGQLPAVKSALVSLAEHMAEGPLPPDAIDAPDVTVERMRAFAVAAKHFYLAAPWRYLSDEDLIHVEAPAMDPGLRYLTVLGGAGVTFGLGFFEKPEDLDALLAAADPRAIVEHWDRWSIWYGPISELSFGDIDLWEEHALPVAGEEAYPMAVRTRADGEILRPDAGALGDLEALLLALAATTEEEVDRGRWSKEVPTCDGLTTVTLAVPALLEPLDGPFQRHPDGMPDRRVMERTFTEIQRFMAESNFQSMEEANAAIQARFMGRPMDAMPSTASTPIEKAQDLMYRAFDSRGRRRIQLAKMALEVSPDCADAYVLLAEESPDPETARALYAQGMAAGERALGPKMFEEEVGSFWGPVQTRPYMRARYGLAGCLEDLGREDEAIGHYRELLRLNPNDNQGVRDILLPLLLTVGRNADAGALLAQYADDITAVWKYGWALWTFRQQGDSPSARERLRDAARANPHVPAYLAGKRPIPEFLPDGYSLGSPEEAMLCAAEFIDVWNETPGAIPWLLAAAPKKESRKRRRR
jgi:tetratricopeptide (TPR) repeat protein